MAKQAFAKKETQPAWWYNRKLVLPYGEYQAHVKMSTSDPHRMKPSLLATILGDALPLSSS
jgi:hypothetical protein